MNILKRITAAGFLILAICISLSGQCKTFAKNTCLPMLGEYTHDGNYHATVLTEGEEAELFKTFYSDMEYRMVVRGDETIPPVEFTVMDANRNIVYSNKDAGLSGVWDFRLESSQQLKVVIRVGTTGSSGTTPSKGCVAIMFGFKVK